MATDAYSARIISAMSAHRMSDEPSST